MGNSGVLPGRSFPLGATVTERGVNFCLFSQSATALELLLFDGPNDPKPTRVVRFEPACHRTFYYWHMLVPEVGAGQVYAYRAYGPFAPARGQRFDGEKVLLDPYARAVVGWRNYSREAAIRPGDNCAQALRAVVTDPGAYDWEGDTPLNTPYARTVIYELHVGGFTRHPNSGVPASKRGTYAGLTEKIPYLQSLGVTAVELMPIHQFDEQDARPGLTNYWGYSSLAFFAPHRPYSSRQDPTGPLDEFRDLVKALHRAGIEVILDVVFNHTAEGNHTGPTLSFKGLENQVYYMLEAENPALYRNYSGCGNTVKANHPIVGRLILDCLRYWVAEMHVDGFRFDLASVLSRNLYGVPVDKPAILWSIESDPILAGTKIIAEAWDAAGLYQVGSFFGERFAEWNGPYRDDVRRFIKSDSHTVAKLVSRLLASPDIYYLPDREPNHSINFVTCHDGFTLNDLVSYNQKHNAANGEDSRDGADDNFSWNCGVEGPTDDREIEALRLRQIKNCLTVLFVSQGTPMIAMGDEVRRTQRGNNNAYCQDSELSWFDWSLLEKNADPLRFARALIHFSQSLKLTQLEHILAFAPDGERPYAVLHGVRVHQPDLSGDSHALALGLHYPGAGEHLHVLLNAYWEALDFELPPPPPGLVWHRIVDTARPAPEDIAGRPDAPPVLAGAYRAGARSTVVLLALSA
ncbi:glycogen debranching protein GlgX [Gloeobacter morelensis]|uniref:Glycogen debranching protein GlgX n=1 Tax=Gloeobacter morelensis MG652769 TaxID=2781736 RepID=A0ABY3PRP8_9CYAN|nr:glycogen debranching protein GlgX [Gloeobacter morelensis]UFP96295.1 glycogen debranching protein GlgX [Gloeobacter morelensis MG652769]